jgi:cytochrome c peroxidase
MRRPFLVAFVSLVTFAAFATETEVAFTPDEAQRILTFGPWPPPFARDPSNRVSGDPAAIDLGRRLFADAPLSPNGYIACVTCHQTDRAWTDGISRAHAMGPLERNTPSVANAWLNRWFGWGGAADSLWAASLRPLLDANEIGTTPQRVVDRFRLNDDLACRYRRVFGRAPDHADEVLLVNIAKAIAAFQETLTTGRTLFDEFRDALARGDRRAMAAYPAAAQRGLKIFVGRGNCFFCHSGPAFTNGEFRSSSRAARPTRGATKASVRCTRAASTCSVRTTTTRRDRRRRRRATSRSRRATGASSRRLPCAMSRLPRPTCTTARSRRCAMSFVTIRI